MLFHIPAMPLPMLPVNIVSGLYFSLNIVTNTKKLAHPRISASMISIRIFSFPFRSAPEYSSFISSPVLLIRS